MHADTLTAVPCSARPADPWMTAMQAGDYEAAWRISDRVLQERRGVPCWHRPRHEQYIWNGEPVDDRRVLIRCYHGLGDTIQFIRYASLLRGLAREVTVWAQSTLLPLIETAPGVDRVHPLHDGVPDVAYDVDLEIMELPHLFRSTLTSLPADVPYLRLPPRPGSPGDELQVGVVWRSGEWDDRRSLATAALAPLMTVPGLRWHALQQGPALAEWRSEWGTISATADATELAHTMQNLDLVISVDSFPAHLAGALGVPTWTLLHAEPDWRWMRDRRDSPWYPTMRLWRQPRPGDWGRVIEEIRNALARVAPDERIR